MHEWGEEDFDWKGLDDCCDIIITICRRYGRFGGQIKEKYGTLRFYVMFSELSLHTLIYPGYIYCQFPKWLWNLDWKLRPILGIFNKPFFWWQKKIYNYAYQKALKKYPYLRDEILHSADFPEFIEGGMEIHNKYWKEVE